MVRSSVMLTEQQWHEGLSGFIFLDRGNYPPLKDVCPLEKAVIGKYMYGTPFIATPILNCPSFASAVADFSGKNTICSWVGFQFYVF